MKQIINNQIHDFPQIKEEKVKVKIQKLNLNGEKEVKLFS